MPATILSPLFAGLFALKDNQNMHDFVTILQSQDHPCTKTFELCEGSFLPVQQKHAYLYQVDERQVSGLADLAKLLSELEGNDRACVIRGKASKDFVGVPVRRTRINFNEAPRQWCMIDIDDLPIPKGLDDWKDRPNDLVRAAVSELPQEFRAAECWCQFSSSMGIKQDKIRVHLWFWLSRKVSDHEMKVWLQDAPVDLRLFNKVQEHFTAKPIFLYGAADPLPSRSFLYDAGSGQSTVQVPDDLESRALKSINRPRRVRAGGIVEHQDIIRDSKTNLVTDGREKLLFDLSNEVTQELVRANTDKVHPTAGQIAERLWEWFREEADLSDGKWKYSHAEEKAKRRFQELEDGAFTFTAQGADNTLFPVEGSYFEMDLVSKEEGEQVLGDTLAKFFEDVADGECPRQAIKITMGAGKTTRTIEELKECFDRASDKTVEVYVPRHDIADEFEKRLAEGSGVNARVIHIYPRTGGKIDQATGERQFIPLCKRSDYVRELEKNGHSVYNLACQSSESESCQHYSDCEYLGQFRPEMIKQHNGNTIRIYQHAQLGLPRNTFEADAEPDLVVVDESILPTLIDTDTSVTLEDIRSYFRTDSISQIGNIIADALKDESPVLTSLRDGGVISDDLARISFESVRPEMVFDGRSETLPNVRSAKLYRNLLKVLKVIREEYALGNRGHVERLVYNSQNQTAEISILKESRIPENVPLLLLDATADQMLLEKILGPLDFKQIDIEQKAFVTQVYDHTGSNTWWNSSPDKVDELVVVLNSWVQYGESPLVVAHKSLADALEANRDLRAEVKVMNFGGVRGSNDAEGCSVVFITGRNQLPPPVVDLKARAIFWDDTPLGHDDVGEYLPLEVRGYSLGPSYQGAPAGVRVRAFSDQRIEAVHQQERELETVQAISRLRLVHSEYVKRVFLLGNLPVPIPVDRLTTWDDLMPDPLEQRLIEEGHLPISAKGLVHFLPDLATNDDAARKKLARSSVTDPRTFSKVMPELSMALIMVARFKAGVGRKTVHQHLFFEKSAIAERTNDELGQMVLASGHMDYTETKELLESKWGQVDDLTIDFWSKPSGE